MTLGELRRQYRRQAVGRRLNARDVDLLIVDTLGKPLSWLIAHDEDDLGEEDAAAVEAKVSRRLRGEPLQYIRGETEFFGRRFFVDPRALIPRPETELLVELLISRLNGGESVLDVGTGTGCIAVSAALEVPGIRVIALDQSIDALFLARANAEQLGAHIRLLSSDLVSSVRGPFDVIVSNPPYIPASEIQSLQIEVRSYEPILALSPGPTGLECIERIFREGRRVLAPGGCLMIEIGYGQSGAVRDLALATGWTIESIHNDLAAIPRVVISSPA